MDLREVLLVLHIVGASTWLGANIIQAVVPPLMAKHGEAATAGWYRVAGKLSSRLYMPASVVILITGILMVIDSASIGFGTTFVTIGFGMIIVGAILGIVVFDPGSKAAALAVESGDVVRIKSAVGRLARFGTVDTLLLIFTITAMVLNLGL